MAKSYLNNANLPRGIRNNNPGNLVMTTIAWQGKVSRANNRDGHFEQFIELRYGIRAMMRDIISDINGGQNNIVDLISTYAPSFENNTTAYINSVAQAVGLSPTAAIDLSQSTLIALCKIIIRVENGSTAAAYVLDQDYQDAINILGITLKKKAQ